MARTSTRETLEAMRDAPEEARRVRRQLSQLKESERKGRKVPEPYRASLLHRLDLLPTHGGLGPRRARRHGGGGRCVGVCARRRMPFVMPRGRVSSGWWGWGATPEAERGPHGGHRANLHTEAKKRYQVRQPPPALWKFARV